MIKTMIKKWIRVCAILQAVICAQAETIDDIVTSANGPTALQTAIEAANEGDVILVGPGTYSPIRTNGKKITIKSTDGVASTIIDGGSTNRCATLADIALDEEDGVVIEGSTLVGFTLMRGYNRCVEGVTEICTDGGAVFGGTVVNCVIKDSESYWIEDGYDDGCGGGACRAALYNCLITGNTAAEGAGASDCILYNCTIVANVDDSCPVAYSEAYNCIISGGGYLDTWNTEYNDCIAPSGEYIFDDVLSKGDIKFVNPAAGDYRLQQGSAAIDAGTPAYVQSLNSQYGDLDKNERVKNTVDIGAYEYGASPIIVPTEEKAFAADDVTIVGFTGKYDGAAHGVGVTVKDGIENVVVRYAPDNGMPTLSWSETSPTITDVGAMTVWCEIAASGYITQTNSATVVISPREVTLTSGSANKAYDGTALVNENVTVGGDGFVDGEGASYNVTGSQTDVGESDNTFTYTFNGNTKADNYIITTVNGTLTVTAANIGGSEEIVLGDWYEAHLDDEATMCARWDDFWMGANVAIPVTGLSTPISASDVVVTAGTYSEFGTPIVLSESEMWNRYGAPVLEQKNLGNVDFDEYDNVWQNWDAEEDGAYGYELSADIWPDWAQVSGRQWILIPTGVPRLGTHTFSVKINGVEHNEYVVSFVMAEDQEAVPLKEFKVEFDACGGSVSEAERIVVERTALGALPTPMREGYTFDGWWTAEKDGIQVTPDTLVVEPITYYAHWVSIFSFESVSGDTIKITGFRDPSQIISTLIIPNTIEDKAVVSIGDGAFANSQCGMEKLILSMFCTNISDKAFNGVASLSEVVFVETRKWDDPSQEAILSIGRYAFAGTGMVELELPKTVGNVGDYAFANCKAMSSITILGAPAVGSVPFRRCGMDVGGVTVHLDPALANDSVYMDKLSQQCWGNVTVRADAIVTRMTLSSLAMSASEIELSVSVEKAASWGKVDTSLVKVAYRESLSEKPIMLGPSSVTENADGSLTVKVVAPKGNSGFFHVVLETK